jgi:hypothetical protein
VGSKEIVASHDETTATPTVPAPAGPAAPAPTSPPSGTPAPVAPPVRTTEGITPAAVGQNLWDNAWGATLALILGFGALGGLVVDLIAVGGSVEWPHRRARQELTYLPRHRSARHVVDLGVVARMLIGATAAVLATPLVAPPTMLGLLTMAAVAGSAGSAISRTMQDRVLVSVATLGRQIDANDTEHAKLLVDSVLAGTEEGVSAQAGANVRMLSRASGILGAVVARNADPEP